MQGSTKSKISLVLRSIIPIIVGIVIALMPPPEDLAPSAWYYFALFAAVIAGVILEPIPSAAIGIIGVTIAAVSGLVHAKPTDAIRWALSGFSDTTVWLIFAAFLFALGYSKTGLGKRIALYFIKYLGGRTLGLGYSIALADLALAPFMPSNTARGGGTIYPIISNIPPMYGSKPGEGTERKIGSYIMWNTFAADCVTSSMFLTALAPNVLAVSLAAKQGVKVEWLPWFIGFLPVGIILFLLAPFIAYKLYPPEIKASREVPKWAAEELTKLGRMTRGEIIFLAGVILALALWIGATDYIAATTVALLVVSIMLIAGVFSWRDILTYTSAWNVLVWFATLVTLADGLSRVGFIEYVAKSIAPFVSELDLTMAVVVVVAIYYWIHYLFASLTAHVTALYPIFLSVLLQIPGIKPIQAALALAYPLGLMGVISPYATGPAPIFYGSGYVKTREFWTLGLVFGVIFFVLFIAVGVPWLLYVL